MSRCALVFIARKIATMMAGASITASRAGMKPSTGTFPISRKASTALKVTAETDP